MDPLARIRKLLRSPDDITSRLERMQQALGRIEARQTRNVDNLRDAEFQVASQWGEDGIIQYLIRHVPIHRSLFVEFGVQDYAEANTRFLLQNNNWAGLVVDASGENVRRIRSDPIYWRCNLKAECAFIDRENINDIIRRNGIAGDIGLLSIDIDGNDYWVWEAIEAVNPRIVVVEYNSLFGPRARVTIPYQRDFHRSHAHHSNLYWGASIGALELLSKRKGYALVGSNTAGNNAFFVRLDSLGKLCAVSAEEAYVRAQFRESRTVDGELSFLDRDQSVSLIGGLPVVDLAVSRSVAIRDVIT